MYPLLNLLFAPGVIIHELSHALFCLFAGVKIYKIRLFQFGRVAGYVTHGEPAKFYQCWLVSFGPIFINSFVSLLCFSQFVPPYARWQPLLLLWLGVAAGLHAIPSDGDAKSLLATINGRVLRNPFLIIGYPLVALLYLLNFFKRLHVDFLYTGLLFWLGAYYLK